MIFHPSAFSILLLLLHGGYLHPTQSQQADSTRSLRHEDKDWPTYYPTTNRPSLPIPSYSPTAFKVVDIIAPSPPNCSPIGSRTSPPTPGNNDRKITPSPSTRVTKTPSNEEDEDPTEVTFRRGDLRKDITRLGIRVSKGVSVRVIAYAGQFVNLASGSKSTLPFHSSPDGAAVIPLTNGGYVYVSNSEVPEKRGGVFALYFDDAGNVVDYKQLLSGSTRNCSGGATPWKVSCSFIFIVMFHSRLFKTSMITISLC